MRDSNRNRTAGRTRIAGLRLLAAGALLVALGHASLASQADVTIDTIAQALTFHAPFDATVDAAFASGDAKVYVAPSRDARSQARAGLPPAGALQVTAGEGRYGDALRVSLGSAPLVFFKGAGNMPYRHQDWSGTVSLWLSLDPDRDLAPGYSDPLLITSRAWDDASLFIDFTKDDVPRRFRFAAFADREVWNPTKRPWEAVPPGERPMVELTGRRFERGRWTHVAWTWERFNTEDRNALLTAFLDGEAVGWLSGRRQIYSWTPEEVLIAIGIDYRGSIDDLAIFDRALTPAELRALHALPGGVADLHRGRSR